MWSDPDSDETQKNFRVSPRGCGYLFGQNAVDSFLKVNKVSKIIRAHQLCMEGYQDFFDGKLTTVWSAPNYCYRCGMFYIFIKNTI